MCLEKFSWKQKLHKSPALHGDFEITVNRPQEQ